MGRIQSKGIYSVQWGLNELELRRQMKNWIKGAIRRQSGIEWRGGHDEGSFTCSWGNYYKLSGDESVKEFLIWLRDSYKRWSEKHHFHGFQEGPGDHCNHAFETAEEFITSLYDMDPEDRVNAEILEDIAHHVGNWVEGIPAWYDWEKHRFVSHWLGTKVVRNYPPYDFELAGHARIGTVVIYAYKATRDPKYLEWCEDYANKWADIIERSEGRIPMVTYPKELPPDERMRIYNFDREKVGDPYVGDLWAKVTTHVVRFLLKVYEFIKKPRYLDAVKKAISIYEGVLEEDKLVNLYLEYQEITGQEIYKDKLMRWYENRISPFLQEKLQVPDCLIISRKYGRAFGFNDGRGNIIVYKGPTPTMFLNGFKVSGDVECLNRAMAIAAGQLYLVTYSTRDGREHGCASHRFIHGCGEEAAEILYCATGIDDVSYYNESGVLGLDEEVAVLCDLCDKEAVFYFYNNSDVSKVVGIGFNKPTLSIQKVSGNGRMVNVEGKDMVQVVVAPKDICKVEVETRSE